MATPLSSDQPATYTIRVAGRVSPRWADWFDGFTLTGDSEGTTTLIGLVTDQAQLHGLLAKFGDLGLALVSVEVGQPLGTTTISSTPSSMV
ncbi:MAG: hypothetical protein KKB93_09530 [Actinobacteria bacterium]|nr:hypothetical protein [Actinomycetota bacterium]